MIAKQIKASRQAVVAPLRNEVQALLGGVSLPEGGSADRRLLVDRIAEFVARAGEVPSLGRVLLGWDERTPMCHLVLVVSQEPRPLGALVGESGGDEQRLFHLEHELWGDDRAPIRSHIVHHRYAGKRDDQGLMACASDDRAVLLGALDTRL